MSIDDIASWITVSCYVWSLSFVLFGAVNLGNGGFADFLLEKFGDIKSAYPVVALSIPVLLSGSVCAFWSERSVCDTLYKRKDRSNCCPQRFSQWLRRGQGDWKIERVAFLCIIIPCAQFLLSSAYRKMQACDGSLNDTISRVSNAIGTTATLALGVFLVPVARYSPVMKIFKWDHVKVVVLHVWAGRVVVIGGLAHGLMHMFRWIYWSREDLLTMMFPPVPCFTEAEPMVQPGCNNADTDCSCYDVVRNFTGFLAFVALLVIGVTSLNFVRRHCYKLFFISHVLAGPLLLLMTVLHWNRSILYLTPSILYYIASSFPSMFESWKERRIGVGVRVVSVERLVACPRTKRRPCVSFTFEASNAAIQRFRAGYSVKLRAPSISCLSHPFTVNRVPGKQNQMRIIFKETGSFTSELGRALQSAECVPRVHLEGYLGAGDRVSQLVRHDVAILVAGGIGVTPYLSMLHELHSLLSGQRACLTRKVKLHWICRDASLIEYVRREYFNPLVNQSQLAKSFTIRIVIHDTTRKGDDTQTVTPYSDMENQRQPGYDIAHQRSRSSQRQYGQMFTPSGCDGILGFLNFALIGWFGLATVCYLYVYVQDSQYVATRAISFIAVVTFGLCVSFTTIMIKDKLCLRSWTDNAQCQSETAMQRDEHNPIRPHLDQYQKKAERACLTEVVQGRPATHKLMMGLDEARCPAVFACGPTLLIRDLKKAVDVRSRIRLHQGWNGTPYISFYEEAFET